MGSAPHRHAGETPPDTVVVLLAAGGGVRFEGPHHKLLARLPAGPDGRTVSVLDRAVERAMAAGVGPVVVVTGALDPPLPDGVVRRHNPHWDSGQMSSLRAGIDAARELGARRVVVGLGDQPGIDPAAWRSVAAGRDPISVATYDGVRANPVKLDEAVWDLLPADGDEGARVLMRIRPDLVGEVPCSGSPSDIDTVEDLRRWQNN